MLHLRPNFFRNPLFWVVVALTMIALFIGLGVAYFSVNLDTLLKRQIQNQQYSEILSDLLVNVTTAETGQRGYIITQDPTYLEPYNEAVPHVQKDLIDLRNSPFSSQRMGLTDQIETITDRKLAELQSTLDTDKSQGQSAAIAIVQTNVGNTDMATLRQLISSVSNTQNSELQSETTVMESRTERLKYSAPIAGFLDVILIVTILHLMRRAIQKEQQLDNLKEQFLALASHQLRTPATAVKQYINILLSGGFGKVEKKQKDVLNIINDSNERGIRIANNLLNITRVDSGKANISEEPVDLSRFLDHVVSHYKDAYKKNKRQQIVVTLPKHPVVGRVDQFYVRLIFENLIENASKYSANGTKIHVDLRDRGNKIIFSVKDHGHGIDKKDIPLLFKKFSRLNEAIKKADGSGLGLYLVKQAVELHGGDVKVSSVVGKGSTFTATIDKGI